MFHVLTRTLWRGSLIVTGLLVALFVGMTTVGAAPAAQSQNAAVASLATFGPPAEGAKVILAETSIDGPAIARTYSPQTVLAWTGTDAAHHLNLMTSSDGLHYSNKHILPETSLWRPAVAFIDSGRGSPYGTIVVAWTGTDQAHTLNLEFISTPTFTVREKITFWGETSFTAPALATINGDINSDVYLGWSGNDSGHSLNIIHHATVPKSNDKHTLWGWSSISRPSLSNDPSPNSTNALILSWTGNNNHIYFANSADRVHWTMAKTSPLSQQSAWAPSMVAFYATDVPAHWLAWTGSGTTSTRRVSVQYTQHYPGWSDPSSMITLGETAISSPQLTYNGSGANGQVLLAWTGTDQQHHLNVAVIYVRNS